MTHPEIKVSWVSSFFKGKWDADTYTTLVGVSCLFRG